eukprot:TRINITY_DN50171_c0_g1_i1.p2 TRINITY_DN50171_c0_g1~~TRINITY_DN50171_c0_g1_i1.p2  ORF type:complete len:358 (+),score=42.04 TRINITY_DN50171_c0_g1_i1:80-1153(+)
MRIPVGAFAGAAPGRSGASRRAASAAAAAPDSGSWRERRDRGRRLRGGGDASAALLQPDAPPPALRPLPAAWRPARAAATATGVSRRAQGDPRQWPCEVAHFSPAGRALTAALARALEPEVWPAAQEAADGDTADGDTFHACLLLALRNHPGVAAAYKLARVAVPHQFVTVLVWRFRSSPQSLYAVASTDPRGAVAVLRDLGSEILLRDADVVVGERPGRQIVVECDASDQTEYYRVFPAGRVGPGCDESLLGTLPEGLRNEEMVRESRPPPACATGEVFDWGHSTDDYCVPPEGEEPAAGGDGVLGLELPGTVAARDRRRLQGRALASSDPAAALRALRAEDARQQRAAGCGDAAL